MAGFNPHGGTQGPQFKLPNWLTGNYGKPNYYDVYTKSRKRGSSAPAGLVVGRGANAAGFTPAVTPALAVSIPAGTVQTGSIVQGVTPAGAVDRSQSDEYKSQLAQYQNLIKKQQTQEAEDLGMKIWAQKYGQTPMGQAGGAIGAYNPLLAATFPDATNPGYPAFVPAEELAAGDLGQRAQGEAGPTMQSINPLAAQQAQQIATANQADKATTVKLPIRNRVQAFLYGGM
jgi:hypothetical protein